MTWRISRTPLAALMLVVALLGGATIATGGKLIPSAHAAATPTVVQSATVSDLNENLTSLRVTLPSNVAAGDRVAILVGLGGGNSWNINSISQTEGGTPSLVTSASDGLNDETFVYDGAITNAGSEQVDISLSENPCNGGCQSVFIQSTVTVVELSGAAAPDGHASAVENGTGGTAHTSGTGLTATSAGVNDLDLGLYLDGGSNTTLSLPSGETQVGTKHDAAVTIQWDQGSAAGQTSFGFDTSGSAAYSSIAAASWPTA